MTCLKFDGSKFRMVNGVLTLIDETEHYEPKVSKLVMRDSVVDYANKVERTTPWGDDFTTNDLNLLSNVDNEIIIPKPMRLLVGGSIELIRKTSRNSANDNVSFWWEQKVGGQWFRISPHYQSNYMRNMGGHSEVSQTFGTELFVFPKQSTIRMRHVQVSGNGGVVGVPPNSLSNLVFQLV